MLHFDLYHKTGFIIAEKNATTEKLHYNNSQTRNEWVFVVFWFGRQLDRCFLLYKAGWATEKLWNLKASQQPIYLKNRVGT